MISRPIGVVRRFGLLQSVPVSSTSLTHTGVSGGDSSRANTLMTSLLPSPLWLLNERTSPAMRMSPARDGLSSGRSSSRRRTLIVSTVPESRATSSGNV